MRGLHGTLALAAGAAGALVAVSLVNSRISDHDIAKLCEPRGLNKDKSPRRVMKNEKLIFY